MKNKISVTIASNATVAKITNADTDIKRIVGKLLSYTIAGYEKTTLGKVQGWDGKKSLFSARNCTFPAGFCRSVVGALIKRGYTVNWVKKPLPGINGERLPKVDEFGYQDKYDYQPKSIDKLLQYGQGIANLATGAGKSRVARIAYKTVQRKTLFLTTRSILLYQMKDDFENLLSEKVGVLGDDQWNPVNGFNVGMIQTLSRRLEELSIESELERQIDLEEQDYMRKMESKKSELAKGKIPSKERVDILTKYSKQLKSNRISDKHLVIKVTNKVTNHNERRLETIDFLKSIEFIILEEAHESGGEGYYQVCMNCTNAYYRLALTGTAFMKEDEEANMRLMAVCGAVIIKVSEKDLIDKGILATPKFVFEKLPRPPNLYRSSSWQKAYNVGIVNNAVRNDSIVDKCFLMAAYGLTSMVLVLRKAHGEILKSLIQKEGLRVSFIYGDKSREERNCALKKLESGQIDVLIGTSILDVGVDVPSVGAVILAGGGKAEVNMRQRVGRGLRAKKSGPNICFVFDYLDAHNDHLTKHSSTRRKIIMDTPGFRENVVNEIDPEEYGFNKI